LLKSGNQDLVGLFIAGTQTFDEPGVVTRIPAVALDFGRLQKCRLTELKGRIRHGSASMANPPSNNLIRYQNFLQSCRHRILQESSPKAPPTGNQRVPSDMYTRSMTGDVAIVGAAGAVGRAVGEELGRRGIPYRVVGRDRAKLESAFGGKAAVEAADIGEAPQAERALAGARAVVYAVGVPYPQFELHPVLMRKTVEAAARAGVARLAVVSSVYVYGEPRAEVVSEEHPREPRARKGRLRKEQEDIALAADGRDGLRTLVLRLPDFYGPHAELSLADQAFRGALENKPANWIGNPDLPHEFVFVPDAGPVLVELIEREDSFGRAWNFGGPGTITGREFITAVYRAAGREPKFRVAGPLLLRLGGLFNPLLRELVEMSYLGITPVVLDDSRLARHLGRLGKTPYAEGIPRTMDWYRRERG
jgi:nucleoside-diphosphate-sugar epimerase